MRKFAVLLLCILLTEYAYSQKSNEISSSLGFADNFASNCYILETNNTDSTKFGYEQLDAYFYGIVGIAFLGDKVIITDSYHNNAKVFVDNGNLLKLVALIDFGEPSDFMVGDCYVYENSVYFLDVFRNQFRKYSMDLEKFTTISFHSEIKESSLYFDKLFDSMVISCNDNNIIPSCKYYDMHTGQIIPTTEENLEQSMGLKDDLFYNTFMHDCVKSLCIEIEKGNLFYRCLDFKSVNKEYIFVVENNENNYYFYRVQN